jgi:hypothetical protein
MTCPAREKRPKRKLTGSALRWSGLIGIWKDRDLPDISEFSRQLRNRNQYRLGIPREVSQGNGLAGKQLPASGKHGKSRVKNGTG